MLICISVTKLPQTTNVGIDLNLGFGGQLSLSENLVSSTKVKHQIISDFNQFVTSVSFIYLFVSTR